MFTFSLGPNKQYFLVLGQGYIFDNKKDSREFDLCSLFDRDAINMTLQQWYKMKERETKIKIIALVPWRNKQKLETDKTCTF